MSIDPFAMALGKVEVVTTSNGGLPPEYWAERVTARLMGISENAPEPIKAQALAYKDAMQSVILEGIKRAIASDRAYRK